MSESFKIANTQQTLLSSLKDGHYLSNFHQKTLQALELYFPLHKLEKHKILIETLSSILYQSLNAPQSIGQEYVYMTSISFYDYQNYGKQIRKSRFSLLIFVQFLVLLTKHSMHSFDKLLLGFMMLFGRSFEFWLCKISTIQLVNQNQGMAFRLLGLFVFFQGVFGLDFGHVFKKIHEKLEQKKDSDAKIKMNVQNEQDKDEQMKIKNECGLCLDECTNTSCTPCGHRFCWECILQALKFKEECPECRFFVSMKQVVQIRNI